MVLDKRQRKLKTGFSFLFIIGFFLTNCFAEQVEVTADNFFADEIKLETVLTGNVHIKKGAYDTLDSNKVIIYFDKDKKPIKYVATGNAKFKAIVNQKHYNGKGDTLTYEPGNDTYILNGNAYLNEIETKKEVFGERIIVNQTKGTYEVQSFRSEKSQDKKPVKLIFQIEDSKK